MDNQASCFATETAEEMINNSPPPISSAAKIQKICKPDTCVLIHFHLIFFVHTLNFALIKAVHTFGHKSAFDLFSGTN